MPFEMASPSARHLIRSLLVGGRQRITIPFDHSSSVRGRAVSATQSQTVGCGPAQSAAALTLACIAGERMATGLFLATIICRCGTANQSVQRLLILRPRMNLLPKTSSRWMVTSGELDHWGKPAVICKRGNREFYFCRGSRGGKRIWICWERCWLIFSAVLRAPSRADAEQAARAASSELKRLEPTLDVYLDLASEEFGTPNAEPGSLPNGGPTMPPSMS